MNHKETPGVRPIIPASVPLYIPDLERILRRAVTPAKVDNILVNIDKNIKDILKAVDQVCDELLY